MIIQFEDVVDMLKELFHDKYCFIFFFDYSSGHDKMSPDGLCASSLNKDYGGCQPDMRNSIVADRFYLPWSNLSSRKIKYW